MVKLLCCVRDIPARSIIGIPMLFAHAAVATRWFTDLLKDPNGVVSKHPDDYEVVQYGAYDEGEDAFTLLPEPVVLLSGRQWAEVTVDA